MAEFLRALDHNRDEVEKCTTEGKCEAIIDWVNGHSDELSALSDLGFLNEPESAATNPAIAGKAFCITGNLCVGRREAESLIVKAGGLAKSSVSSKVDYLVVGENGGANKARDAARYGTKCLNETEFWELMGVCPEPTTQTDPDREY